MYIVLYCFAKYMLLLLIVQMISFSLGVPHLAVSVPSARQARAAAACWWGRCPLCRHRHLRCAWSQKLPARRDNTKN